VPNFPGEQWIYDKIRRVEEQETKSRLKQKGRKNDKSKNRTLKKGGGWGGGPGAFGVNQRSQTRSKLTSWRGGVRVGKKGAFAVGGGGEMA